ncbi:BamA/TamA family outer membrane protein, partial [Candidatus Dependentiae bacterium]|nr:BamA/TamA family outer membrane protein [Candidatus Dependentiae bacterium]
NMVPPLNDVRCDDCVLWVPLGGKTMANINAEVRFPLYDRVSGAVFIDGGILTQNCFADIAANRWFGASGFGLRCATPLGPIRFDIGWKWRKRDIKDTSYAFFLTLGHAF